MRDAATQGFAGYRCWDPQVAAEAIRVDAASPSASTLLAVHYPAHITRVVRGRNESGGRVVEEDVYRALFDRAQKLVIVPIIGDSGTGKTHLVQWLRARIEGVENARVVYLPRSGTSLRGLIDLLIQQLEREDELESARQLRHQLEKAFDNLGNRNLGSELLDAMARQLDEVDEEPAEGREGRRRKGLARQLAVLLRVPELRKFWLGDGGAISRFVTGIESEARSDEVRREGFVFRIADLPQVDAIGPLTDLGSKGGQALRELHSSEAIKEAAAHLATEALSGALPKVIGLTGEVTLGHVFRKTRQLLLERGEQLVVLIEDLTKLQGVDRELVSILLDPVEENGEQVLCSLRVAVAVTTGYFSRLDETFRTRAENSGSTFLLDAPYGQTEGAWTNDDVADFISRYLNVARLGVGKIQDSYDQASPQERASRKWIPNRCDECPHASKCHEAFGEVGGRGLYPFNREALAIMTGAVLKDGQFNPRSILGGVAFNPRSILGGVAFATLVHHGDEIVEREFPSRALERDFPDAPPLPGSAVTGASQYRDRDRREVLLRFWGGAPREVVDLKPGIHEAFQLPEIGRPQEIGHGPGQEDPASGDTDGGDGTGGDEPGPNPGQTPEPPIPAAIDRWANGQLLPRAEVVRMQQLLYSAVVRLVPWSTLGVQPEYPFFVGKRGKGFGTVLRPSSFHIEDGSGVVNDTTKVVVPITRSNRDLLLYLDQARQADGGSIIGLGIGGYQYVQKWLEDVASRVVKAIEEAINVSVEGSPLVALASRLFLGAAMSGGLKSFDDRLEVAGLVLNAISSTSESDATDWNRLISDLGERWDDLALDLVSLAESRPSVGAHAAVYRAGRVAAAIGHVLTDWTFSRQLPLLPDDVGSSLKSPSKRELESAVRSQVALVRQQLGELDDLLGQDPWSTSDLCDEIDTAVRSAELVNSFPGSPDQARQRISSLREDGVERFEGALADMPDDGASFGELVLACASLQRQGLQTTVELLTGLDRSLQAACESAESSLADIATGSESSAMDAAREAVVELLGLFGGIK